ncbi:uncharacterized protein G2W53_028140 [Senna tora]|uniref:Uncharacterized protein n=1 Tax=Senna tora TaxID=362788 RepID=A0A834T4Q8_9FABA|nr:uncharacterized protein G2W53_028140 [Senna tora]
MAENCSGGRIKKGEGREACAETWLDGRAKAKEETCSRVAWRVGRFIWGES